MASYVLLDPLPFVAEHRGTAYRFRAHQVGGSGNWRLAAEFGEGSAWLLGGVGTEARLAEVIRSTGIEVRPGTIPAVILGELERTGRARGVPAPGTI